MDRADLGLVGLGVMGRGFARNLADHGLHVLGYDLDRTKNAGGSVPTAPSVEALVAGLSRPRSFFLLVPAGAPVDAAIAVLAPHLEPGDAILDGGNSFFRDTERRERELAAKGIFFLGVGVSGGEEGARTGPSLMVGGDGAAYERARPWLAAAAAKVDGEPCLGYFGIGGAGHYVKMVHNAIEYGWMQLIAESVDLLHRGAGLSWDAVATEAARWNAGPAAGFLVAITADIAARRDPETGSPLLDVISDVARQKGTGKWAVEEAHELVAAVPTIEAAVTARELSVAREQREKLAMPRRPALTEEISLAVGEALYAGMFLTMAQGMALLDAAARKYRYDLSLATVARTWRGGCILRARMLDDVAAAPDPSQLLLDDRVGAAIAARAGDLRTAVKAAIDVELAVPALAASLAYWDGMRDARLSLAVVQAQRDYFGAHGYERRDRPGVFHTRWRE